LVTLSPHIFRSTTAGSVLAASLAGRYAPIIIAKISINNIIARKSNGNAIVGDKSLEKGLMTFNSNPMI
jgi:hypothetical protein